MFQRHYYYFDIAYAIFQFIYFRHDFHGAFRCHYFFSPFRHAAADAFSAILHYRLSHFAIAFAATLLAEAAIFAAPRRCFRRRRCRHFDIFRFADIFHATLAISICALIR